jgi:CRP-like cAMP-binding protein
VSDAVSSGNRLLDALPRPDRDALVEAMRRLRLEQRQVLWEADEPVRAVHFPLTGVISLLTVTRDGSLPKGWPATGSTPWSNAAPDGC